jgi:hypothetical protein
MKDIRLRLIVPFLCTATLKECDKYTVSDIKQAIRKKDWVSMDQYIEGTTFDSFDPSVDDQCFDYEIIEETETPLTKVQKERQKLIDTPIGDLGFSQKLISSLKDANIETVEDIIGLYNHSLLLEIPAINKWLKKNKLETGCYIPAFVMEGDFE